MLEKFKLKTLQNFFKSFQNLSAIVKKNEIRVHPWGMEFNLFQASTYYLGSYHLLMLGCLLLISLTYDVVALPLAERNSRFK